MRCFLRLKMSWGIKPQRFYRLQEQIISAQPVLLTWAGPLSGNHAGLWWLEVRRSTPGPYLEGEEPWPIRGLGQGALTNKKSDLRDSPSLRQLPRESRKRDKTLLRVLWHRQTITSFIRSVSCIEQELFRTETFIDVNFWSCSWWFWQTFEVLQRDQSHPIIRLNLSISGDNCRAIILHHPTRWSKNFLVQRPKR